MPHHVPSLVIHGGAGSISRTNIPPSSAAYKAYTASLHNILTSTYKLLSFPTTTAVEAACHAVVLLEDDPLFNAGKGAVFTRAGTNELEASIMVTRGAGKRGVGVMLLKRVKNPILLAKELLFRGTENTGGSRHNQLSGEEAERLAGEWGLELVDENYFWTEKRWKEHLRGLKRKGEGQEEGQKEGIQARPAATEDLDDEELEEHLPQGTVGCVVRDRWGTICVATSTGGLTNKLPGRIGDTPTLGTGFWAEEWEVEDNKGQSRSSSNAGAEPTQDERRRSGSVWDLLFRSRCTSAPTENASSSHIPLIGEKEKEESSQPSRKKTRAVGLSGTGNGDYFLRLAAAHNVAARCRFGGQSLREALEAVVGEGGEMQRAAEAVGEWGRGGGDGGVIGIDESGDVEMVLNCGGMFRGTIGQDGKSVVAVYRDEKLSREV